MVGADDASLGMAGVCAVCRNAGICRERLVRIFCLKSDYEMTMMKTTRKMI